MPTNVYFLPPQSADGKIFFPLEIVGESHYQKNIREVIGYKYMVEKEDYEYKYDRLIASLILDDENIHDPGNAVRVEIDNQIVGFLTKDDAAIYRQSFANLVLSDCIGTCKAKVFGKRPAAGKMMKFGIWLALEPERGLTIGEAPPKKKGCFAPTVAMLIFVLTAILILGKL